MKPILDEEELNAYSLEIYEDMIKDGRSKIEIQLVINKLYNLLTSDEIKGG